MSEENEKMTDLSNVKGNGSKEEAESKESVDLEEALSEALSQEE